MLAAGLAVCALVLWALVSTLTPADEPSRPPFAIGVVAPAATKPDRGLFAHLDVRVHECGEPVDAILSLAPSSEFWADHGAALRGKVGEVSVAIGGAGIDDATAAPLAAGLEPAPRAPKPELLSSSVTTERGLTVVRARLARWAETRGSVAVRFKAHWLSGRTSILLMFRTCYLRLPQLIGPLAVETTVAASSRAERQSGRSFALSVDPARDLYTIGNNVNVASTLVHAADLDLNLALPSPSTRTSEGTQWSCDSRPVVLSGRPGAGDVSLLAGQATGSVSAFRRALEHTENCGASTVVKESGATAALPAFTLVLGMTFAYAGMDVVLAGFLGLLAAVRHRRAV
jgi:hypothetical protein